MVALPVEPGTEAGKDAALSADIRLLGRVLGEVVRDQAGDEVFDLVEQVRQRAVDARRDGRSPLEELRATLPGRPIEDQLHLIRAYGFLSLLANTAEDVHHERRRRYHRRHGSRPQLGSVEATLDRLVDGGVPAARMAELVGELLVVPVLTAHPTEVRRQTTLDILVAVADLLTRHGELGEDAAERDDLEAQLVLRVLTLWQTAVLRLSKLRVIDEINEALRYFPASLFRALPELEHDLEVMVEDRWLIPADATGVVRMGSWIGGDRDGNPFVTADVLRTATSRAATDGARPPPRGAPGTVLRAVVLRSPRRPVARARRPRRRLRRRVPVPGRRAVPAGAAGPPRPRRRVRPPVARRGRRPT